MYYHQGKAEASVHSRQMIQESASVEVLRKKHHLRWVNILWIRNSRSWDI